jgi:hypothetical protein
VIADATVEVICNSPIIIRYADVVFNMIICSITLFALATIFNFKASPVDIVFESKYFDWFTLFHLTGTTKKLQKKRASFPVVLLSLLLS